MRYAASQLSLIDCTPSVFHPARPDPLAILQLPPNSGDFVLVAKYTTTLEERVKERERERERGTPLP